MSESDLSTSLPLLGTKASGEPFSYLLLSISKNGAEIAICDWLVHRARLFPGEAIELFFSPNFAHHEDAYTPASVESATRDEALSAMKYKLVFNPSLVTSANTNFLIEKEPQQQILQLLKDSIYLKRGIIIYLKHLAPYFSRISTFNKNEYSQLREVLFEDIQANTRKNEVRLQNLFNSIKESSENSNIYYHLNLEDLRACMESEISYDLLEGAFKGMVYKNSCHVYLGGIKALEKRLYLNYNKIVTIYQNHLTNELPLNG